MITAPVTQATAPAVLVAISEVTTVVVPVKFSKPGMVCRINTMDWPLMLSVISEGPDVSSALKSEDMGGVKLPDAEADDFGGRVMLGIDGKDDVVGETAATTLSMLVVEVKVPTVSVVAGALLATSLVIWKVELLLFGVDETGEPLALKLEV